MLTRLIFYSLLAVCCAARLQTGHLIQRQASTLADRLCWEDGKDCDADTTCINCCSGTSYVVDGTNSSVCGYDCLADGTVCQNKTDYNCWQCCNGAYEDDGKTCGGQCLESGTTCNFDSTCALCCNYTYSLNGGSYQCGCLEDGTSCVPGESCYSCCNGAYDDNGFTCGGTCIEDGTECAFGDDCHLCCSYSSYWYSTGTMHCGTEPCFADGESCIPGLTCSNCCSGGAYDGDGTVCGGTCLTEGLECSSLGSCNKCCPTVSDGSSTTVGTSPNDAPTTSSFPIGGSSDWNVSKGSMVCGHESCWEDDTDCVPGFNCYSCCNGAYAGNGTKCGGQCLETGSECNYFSTCSHCCMTYKYNATMGSHICSDY
jgi:hypothetical protein